MKENNEITIIQISEKIGITVKAIEKQISTLRKLGLVKRVGSDKSGSWQIMDEE